MYVKDHPDSWSNTLIDLFDLPWRDRQIISNAYHSGIDSIIAAFTFLGLCKYKNIIPYNFLFSIALEFASQSTPNNNSGQWIQKSTFMPVGL